MTTVAGRTIIVTGASAGLGAHFARLYAAAGARVVLAARRVDRVEALAASIEGEGGEALPVAMDVGDADSVAAAFDAAEARFGLVDTIVANAGVSMVGRSTDLSADAIRQVLDTNIAGVYLTVREGARRLIASGSRDSGAGRVIIIGSITSHMTAVGDAAYAASKAAVAHLGRNFAREWVRQGINVNVIQPGYIQSELAGDLYQTEAGAQKIAAFHRRRLQPVTSLDPFMLLFASDASACVTGAVIDVDDGQSL
jgi:NAD(P)-dependent dehydrogenase (short-subunit alcohol dehydrogenase family)